MTTYNEEHCADVHAPKATCAQCGDAVHTCERAEQVGYIYSCPAHPEGYESAGKWFCNDRCGDVYFADKAMKHLADKVWDGTGTLAVHDKIKGLDVKCPECYHEFKVDVA